MKIAPAHTADYTQAIAGCKAEIATKTTQDLGAVIDDQSVAYTRSKGPHKAILNFRVWLTTSDGSKTLKRVRCTALKNGEVLDLHYD